MNIAIITGASSGMGREFALQLDSIFQKMDEIWLIARRGDRLKELSEAMRNKTRIFAVDVTDEKQMSFFYKSLAQEKPVIRMLVNCAGYGYMGEFTELEKKPQIGMLEVNCKALTELTYECIPYMKKNSRIIQLASSAAFLPQPGFAVYAATKSYVLSFSRALGEELVKRQIYVTAVCPGPVETEFFDIAERYGKTLAVKKLTIVQPERVVREALLASKEKKSIAVCSGWIKLFHLISSLLPHPFILKIMRLIK
ncbi:MAG: SDR family NAD(P)-dependent oxidoreductase [Clostridiales bacterium]|nr:SDR family NAD(P)-dependent oxidoreductase [Clostridiales bacterium]